MPFLESASKLANSEGSPSQECVIRVTKTLEIAHGDLTIFPDEVGTMIISEIFCRKLRKEDDGLE